MFQAYRNCSDITIVESNFELTVCDGNPGRIDTNFTDDEELLNLSDNELDNTDTTSRTLHDTLLPTNMNAMAANTTMNTTGPTKKKFNFNPSKTRK